MKKYSKQIALAVIIVLAIGIITIAVVMNSINQNSQFTLGDYTVVSEGNGVSIVSYDGDNTSLTIPAKIEGKKVVSISQKAFNSSKVTSLSFEDNANLELDDYCFSGNTTLVSVTLPSNLTSVPAYCFQNCTALRTIVMPDSITYIGSYAFYGCTYLGKDITTDSNGDQWLELPKSLNEICDNAFYECDTLDCIKIPTTLKNIGNNAFRGSAIRKIGVYDDGENCIEVIGNYAFYDTQLYSKSDEELKLAKLTYIGNYAFASTKLNFQYFYIYPSVTDIGDYAFSGSTSLKKVIFDEDLSTSVILGSNMFLTCTALNSVTLPNNMKSLPSGMFMGCIQLLSTSPLILPESLETINDGALSFFATSSKSTKTCNYRVLFNHTKGDGTVEQVEYNDYFRTTTLDSYYNKNGVKTNHYVVTDYYSSTTTPTTLYAYVGLYDDDSYYYQDSAKTKKSYAFKFFTAANKLNTIKKISGYAFAGSQFSLLCLPGAVNELGSSIVYKSKITTLYFDSDSVSKTFVIDENAFNDLSYTDSDSFRCYVLGGRSSVSKLAGSSIQTILDNMGVYLDAAVTPD